MHQSNLEFVGFRLRFFASFIDFVIFNILFFSLFGEGWQTLPISLKTLDFSSLDIAKTLLIWDIYGWEKFLFSYSDFIASFLIPLITTLIFWIAFAATPGKMLLRAKILNANTGGKPTKTQFLIRYLCYFISSFFFMLGFLWIIWDKRKQGWHDKIANTVVVRQTTQKVFFPKEK